jgi:hypothetical protein
VPWAALPVASASNARLLKGNLREDDVSRRTASSTTECVAHLNAVRSSITAIPALRLKLAMIWSRSEDCTSNDAGNNFFKHLYKGADSLLCIIRFGLLTCVLRTAAASSASESGVAAAEHHTARRRTANGKRAMAVPELKCSSRVQASGARKQ